ncbi:MAG: superoxide dismutase [Candidatus Latescibacteria bacterium]|nr:superoxide dismutase [Candidatus Latescibacterota bacterium]NIM22489.1 superoxide dismutase [Candidatus Latescibacterota bacterium]NIM64803.1 superoxide dismutase [Candidatus Latescibacterota bacterium]NIO01311.1 superoxide dismutase [Candidatus Latescibacterota bacterium]NIO27800.1 superoxide dismutase [Candidatus Latescibacterota bacterium]
MKKILLYVFVVLLFAAPFKKAIAHCEIPCGIYGDKMRIEMIKEHISTIEKSMKMIAELSQGQSVNYNQLVRWIDNKETHANEIQHIVAQYFLTQRVKPTDEQDAAKHKKYLKHLSLLHEMLVYAMKTKQSIDLDNVAKLKALTDTFNDSYFEAKK